LPFSSLLNDTITIRKVSGAVIGPYKCSVQGGNSVHIMQGDVDVEEGDTVERQLPMGRIEEFEVLEAQYSSGLHMIPPSWRLHVRKVGSRKPDGHKTTNIHIANANAIQIGDHNYQQISSAFQLLLQAIDESNATPEQKKEAKSKLAELLRHPAITASFGAAAGALVKSVLGG